MVEPILQALLESFWIYYGLDWISFASGTWGMYLISEKRRSGFAFQIVGVSSAIACSLIAGQFGFVAANAVTLCIVSYGFWNWDTQKTMNHVNDEYAINQEYVDVIYVRSSDDLEDLENYEQADERHLIVRNYAGSFDKGLIRRLLPDDVDIFEIQNR